MKVHYRYLPDGTIWATETGGNERTVAQWKQHYDHNENKPLDGNYGSVWDYVTKDRFSFYSIKTWDAKVRKLYTVEDYFIAETWNEGGCRHNGNIIEKIVANVYH